jgi:hypothetical protein
MDNLFFFYKDSQGKDLFFDTKLIAHTEYNTTCDNYTVFLRNCSVNSGPAQRVYLKPTDYVMLINSIKNGIK